MRFKLKKVLLSLIGFELLLREVLKLLHRGMYSIREDVGKRLIELTIKGMLLLLLMGLFTLAFIFGMLGLALYFNEVLYSGYKGFFIASGGCIGLSLLLLVLSKVRWLRSGP
ncbi:MAG: hypothetical protein AAF392_02255 [Bacteroidota bacterium]